MNYEGKLYGHLGGRKYFYTGKTSEDWDKLERENAELKRQVKHMDKYLRAVDAATDIETARRRANKGLNMKGGEG